MISLFLNSRKRPQLLNNLLYSILNTTFNLKNIEVLIRIDNDDIDTQQLLYDAKSSFIIKVFQGPKLNNLHTSINELAIKSIGDFLFILNDDVQILSQSWDKELDNINASEPWYIHTIDNSIDKVLEKKYASFPILTRAAYNTLGHFMSDKLVGLGGDVYLWRIFNSLNKIYYSNIKLDHILHRTIQDVRSPDETAHIMRQNTWQHNIDPWTMDISNEVDKFNNNE